MSISNRMHYAGFAILAILVFAGTARAEETQHCFHTGNGSYVCMDAANPWTESTPASAASASPYGASTPTTGSAAVYTPTVAIPEYAGWSYSDTRLNKRGVPERVYCHDPRAWLREIYQSCRYESYVQAYQQASPSPYAAAGTDALPSGCVVQQGSSSILFGLFKWSGPVAACPARQTIGVALGYYGGSYYYGYHAFNANCTYYDPIGHGLLGPPGWKRC